MGIKNLTPFLKKSCPDAFVDIPYSFFRGKRIAVDSDYVLMKLMSRSHKEIVNLTDVCVEEPERKKIIERLLEHLKDEIVKFLKFGITLIFIFDGDYIDEKSETQLKRKEDKKKRIQEAEKIKKEILELDELERTPQMTTNLRKKMQHLGYVSTEEKKLIFLILKSLGIPVLRATGEGEKLCAMLNLEGKVDAVYTRDTDVLAMGCPLMFGEEAGWVHNPKSGKMEMSLKCVQFKPILGELKMEYSSFLDLCIMSGCDFNSNIPKIGVGKAYKILKESKRIEDIPSKYDKTILNYDRCREIFKRERSKDICQEEINLNIVNSFNHEILRENNIEDWIYEFQELYKNLPIPSNIFIEKIPSYSSSIIKLNILNSKKIPKQKASPKKYNMKIVKSLNSDQIKKYKEREEKKMEEEKKEVKEAQKKIIKLKIIPS